MLKKRLAQSVAILVLLIPAAVVADADLTLKSIMQGLRNNLVEISDGLLTDDFAMVARGAAAIATHPQIPADQVTRVAAELGREMAAFKQMDTLVHDLSVAIEAAAQDRTQDVAVSAYQQMFDACLACHATYKDRVVAALSVQSGQ